MADASADERTILGHTVHFWDIRLNSTGEETLKAAESMHNSPLVSANMTSFQSFRTMKPSVMTDYVFALMVENFGWLIPSLLIAFFSFVMISITVKHRRKAAEGGFSDAMALGTAILLLVQAAIHILGPFRILPFSGITLPFLSIGLNSLIACLLLLTTTEDSPDISITKSDTDIETSYFKQVSMHSQLFYHKPCHALYFQILYDDIFHHFVFRVQDTLPTVFYQSFQAAASLITEGDNDITVFSFFLFFNNNKIAWLNSGIDHRFSSGA